MASITGRLGSSKSPPESWRNLWISTATATGGMAASLAFLTVVVGFSPWILVPFGLLLVLFIAKATQMAIKGSRQGWRWPPL